MVAVLQKVEAVPELEVSGQDRQAQAVVQDADRDYLTTAPLRLRSTATSVYGQVDGQDGRSEHGARPP